jgi:hypothetical protein
MVRLLPLALVVAACTASDLPRLQLAVGGDGTLQIALVRGPQHVFGSTSATANGIDLGAAVIANGNPGRLGDQAASPATATFSIAMTQLGTDVHVEVTEGDEHYLLDAPGLGAPRALAILNFTQPLSAGQWLVLTDGASDRFGGDFAVMQGTQTCTVQWASRELRSPSGLELQLSSDLARDWWCTPKPAPGSIVSAQLAIDLLPNAIATSCSGPDLACEQIEVPALHAVADVTVQL